MFWIVLTLKCLAVVVITGLAMAQLPDGRFTDIVGTIVWASICVALVRQSLRKRAAEPKKLP